MGERNLTAITGDLIESRTEALHLRMQLQHTIVRVLEELNWSLQHHIARPFALTAGDEIQGLLKSPRETVAAISILTDRMTETLGHGPVMRFGVGWGELSTGFLNERSTVEQLDGECFHRARDMIKEARKKKAWARFSGFGRVTDATLNTLFELMAEFRSGWTQTQLMYIQDMRTGAKRVDVARKRGVSPSVITESLQASRFNAIMNAERTASLILDTLEWRQEAPTEASS